MSENQTQTLVARVCNIEILQRLESLGILSTGALTYLRCDDYFLDQARVLKSKNLIVIVKNVKNVNSFMGKPHKK